MQSTSDLDEGPCSFQISSIWTHSSLDWSQSHHYTWAMDLHLPRMHMDEVWTTCSAIATRFLLPHSFNSVQLYWPVFQLVLPAFQHSTKLSAFARETRQTTSNHNHRFTVVVLCPCSQAPHTWENLHDGWQTCWVHKHYAWYL